MRFAVVMLIALAGCNRETELSLVRPPAGWTETTDGNAAAVAGLGIDYRERKTLEIHTYVAPSGERLRAIRVTAELPPQTLLGRLTRYRRPNPTETFGELVIDSLEAEDERHLGIQATRPPSPDPNVIVRSPTLLMSCLAPAGGVVDAKGPCVRAMLATVTATKDAADGTWLYWYLGGLAFAALVIGRRLQVPLRLLPPKPTGRLPEARLRG